VGDWGRGGSESQRKVASMMAQLGGCYRPSFVVSTGDNFYESGLRGPEDPFFTQTFTDVYTDDSLMVPWYAVLGNHDYGELDREQLRLCSSPNFTNCPAGCCYSPTWQTNMSNRDWRWNARQGAWRQGFGNGLLDIVFVDTSPFVTKHVTLPGAQPALQPGAQPALQQLSTTPAPTTSLPA
ncbi:metallophos domain-containing protein, partial [Haematococcus lacustris]